MPPPVKGQKALNVSYNDEFQILILEALLQSLQILQRRSLHSFYIALKDSLLFLLFL